MIIVIWIISISLIYFKYIKDIYKQKMLSLQRSNCNVRDFAVGTLGNVNHSLSASLSRSIQSIEKQ